MKTFKLTYRYYLTALLIILLPTWFVIFRSMNLDVVLMQEFITNITQRNATGQLSEEWMTTEYDIVILANNSIQTFYYNDLTMIYISCAVAFAMIFDLLYMSGKRKDYIRMLPIKQTEWLGIRYLFTLLLVELPILSYPLGASISAGRCASLCQDAGILLSSGAESIIQIYFLPVLINDSCKTLALITLYFVAKELCNNAIAAICLWTGIVALPILFYLFAEMLGISSFLDWSVKLLAWMDNAQIVFLEEQWYNIDKVRWQFDVFMLFVTAVEIFILFLLMKDRKRRESGVFCYPVISAIFLLFVLIWSFIFINNANWIFDPTKMNLLALLLSVLISAGVYLLIRPKNTKLKIKRK